MGGGGSRQRNYIPPEKIDRDHEGQSWLNKPLEEVTELIEKDKNSTVFLDRVNQLCRENVLNEGVTIPPLTLPLTEEFWSEENSKNFRISVEVEAMRFDRMRWEKLWCVIVGPRMFLFSNKGDLKPRFLIQCTFVIPDAQGRQQMLGLKGEYIKYIEVDETRRRHRIFHGGDGNDGCLWLRTFDEANQKWDELLKALMEEYWTPENLAAKAEKYVRFEHGLCDELAESYDKANQIKVNLVEKGLPLDHDMTNHPFLSNKKIKAEHAYIQTDHLDENGNFCDEGIWERFYLCLLPSHLFAYRHSDDDCPVAHIVTFRHAIRRIPCKHGNEIALVTSSRTIKLRFHDRYDTFEWVYALMVSTRESNIGAILLELHQEMQQNISKAHAMKEPVAADDRYLKEIIIKEHKDTELVTYPLGVGPNTIGCKYRQDKGGTKKGKDTVESIHHTIGLVDDTLHTLHCRIDVRESGDKFSMLLTDCVTKDGCRINGKSLRPHGPITTGDIIEIGHHTVCSIGPEDPVKLEAALKKRAEREAARMGARELE